MVVKVSAASQTTPACLLILVLLVLVDGHIHARFLALVGKGDLEVITLLRLATVKVSSHGVCGLRLVVLLFALSAVCLLKVIYHTFCIQILFLSFLFIVLVLVLIKVIFSIVFSVIFYFLLLLKYHHIGIPATTHGIDNLLGCVESELGILVVRCHILLLLSLKMLILMELLMLAQLI